MGKRVLLLTLILSLVLCVPVFATPEDNTDGLVDGVVEEVVLSEAEIALQNFKEQVNNKGKDTKVYITIINAPVEEEVTNETTEQTTDVVTDTTTTKTEVEKTLYFTVAASGGAEEVRYFTVDDEAFALWMDEIKESVLNDAKAGLALLSTSDVTLDHIKFKVWGEFFTDYYGQSMTSFPVKDIVLKYDNYEFVFKRTDDSKNFFLNTFIPPLIEVIEEEAANYPVKRYALQIDSGSLLKDYECDLSSVREISTVLPFDGAEEHIFYNVGDTYGMGLAREYVDILRGYLEGHKKGYDRRVEGDVPGCVNVLSCITLLRNISGGTLSDKSLSDFTMYKELAVCLDTKELIDTTNMTTENQDLRYSDFKLNLDNLVLCPIKDTVVIIQPTYLECFSYGGYERNFGRTLDATNFISTGDLNFTYTISEGQSVKVPIQYFCGDNGYLDSRLGNAPFLVYYSSYVPYDLLVNWAYNQSSSYMDEEQRDVFLDRIESDLKKLNREEDFKTYVKAAGHTPESTKKLIIGIIVAVLVVALVVVGIIFYKKLKKLNTPIANPNGGALFMDNDFDDDDDDDTYGSFELK